MALLTAVVLPKAGAFVYFSSTSSHRNSPCATTNTPNFDHSHRRTSRIQNTFSNQAVTMAPSALENSTEATIDTGGELLTQTSVVLEHFDQASSNEASPLLPPHVLQDDHTHGKGDSVGHKRKRSPSISNELPTPKIQKITFNHTFNVKLSGKFNGHAVRKTREESLQDAKTAVKDGADSPFHGHLIMFADAGQSRVAGSTMGGLGITYRSLDTWVDRLFCASGVNNSSSFEMLAVGCALQICAGLAEEEVGRFSIVTIFTDSEAAVSALRNGGGGSQPASIVARERMLAEATKVNDLGIKIHLHWVKGHARDEGNARADRLVRAATRGALLRYAPSPIARTADEIDITPFQG
ncbi:hypothetical protein NA57DRAFT_81477 [Rhizodiscina lignyota]|uniref:RNase H type-1 domain-containing protein n=1 Tax=Rhizodiscina lignyota TaxID=1504668 RepID=A0A9P4I6U6_9PEZI|nr:hypothetical protein NA57DRAFT_81477 [Rhizodiscina lignyota]